MKLEKIVVGLLTTTALCCQTALASIYPGNVDIVNTDLPYPNQKVLEVDYHMFGSEIFNNGNTVNFALTQDGGKSGINIGRDFADISCGSGGLGGTMRCVPSSSTQTYRVNLDSVLSEQNKKVLADSCVPYEFKVKASYSISSALSFNTVKIGGEGAPDWLVSSGSFSPNQVAAGDQVVINAVVSSANCAQKSGTAPTLAVFLANADKQLIYFYGETPIRLPNGSSHTITVPMLSGLTAGTYYLVLAVDRTNVVAETNENNNIAMGKITVIDSAVGGQSIAPENEQSANTSGSMTYLSRTDEDNQNFVDPQLPVTPGMQVLKSREINQDDLFNAINQLDAVALPEHQE
ncbi:CARDB domain-containing protein [Vibrio rhizosphaerae]|uniref:CARDB domain-containing protein n=1 Tax=Vibrio rhizosphaerae TaxID=398736 RepID=A0ABU4ISI1_9VIBR|nr:CARDB domain-containing protein [Vibrio rhizosphaerae]MDW6091671.1 CARDB domain-containing protein [Vibrio rhizosphaerae]